ncbi:ubiquitin carrier protein [Rutstroemia sp. NJR-2017a BBW]|nr:ubiquitin carrier protein [Rutstroemia sp. NJR-2017a BBW]
MVASAFGTIAAPLLRRGFSASDGKVAEPIDYQMPAWGVALIVSTLLVFAAADFMVQYTYSRIIPTLLMVESPQAILFEPIKSDDPDAKVDPQEVDLCLVKQAPITSSFRSTVQHLRAKGGKLAIFRGLSMSIVSAIVFQWYIGFFSSFLPMMFAHFIAMVLSAPFYLAWTSIVISNPSPLPWYKRMPNLATVKKVMIPTAHFALAKELTIMLPLYLARSYGFHEMNPEDCMNMGKNEFTMTFAKGLSVLILAGALAFSIYIPANVILTRVQASLLPETEEAIVPFDRTFGGKVVAEEVGGTGALGMLDAWRTFDRSSRVRLLKAYAKVFAMEIALGFAFTALIISEIFMIVGTDLSKFNLDSQFAAVRELTRR